jgi:hypothetical protein
MAQQLPATPMRWSVVDVAAPPADAADWGRRTLHLKWKSRLAPTAIAWQIGYDAAAVTPGDRALLKEDETSLDAWNLCLRQAWRRSGRLLVFSSLSASQDDDGAWQVDVPLRGLVDNTSLQVATTPVGAVDLTEVRLSGTAPRTSPRTLDVSQQLQLEPRGGQGWAVSGRWPMSASSASITFTREQSLQIMDARVNKIDYQTKTASGRVSTASVFPMQIFADSYPHDGIGASIPVEAADPLINLEQVTPAEALPTPQLTITYSARALWFEAAGTPPYHLRVGPKSTRRPDQISESDAALLGNSYATPADTIKPPIAVAQNAHKTDTLRPAAAIATPEELQAATDNRMAVLIALLSTIAFALLVAADLSVRARIAAIRTDRS